MNLIWSIKSFPACSLNIPKFGAYFSLNFFLLLAAFESLNVIPAVTTAEAAIEPAKKLRREMFFCSFILLTPNLDEPEFLLTVMIR